MSSIYHNKFFAMGTRFNAILPGLDSEEGDRVFQLIKREISRIEGKLSRFRPDSDVSGMNRIAKSHQCELDDELFDIMKACVWCSGITGGAFDVTLRPLMEYWKNKHHGKLPDHEWEELRKSLGMHHIHLDEANKTIKFGSSQLEVDLGGFGKGYALEKIREMIDNLRVTCAFISFGESSVLAIGDHPAGGAWKIGINDHTKPGFPAYRFEVSKGSVSTSSNFYVADDGTLKNHLHVIDPVTGLPVDQCVSVSVVAQSPVLAEMMSTAFLVMADEKIYEVLDQYEGMEAVKINYESGEAQIILFDKINS
jgi:thiamine biosynthesis lipoprotein